MVEPEHFNHLFYYYNNILERDTSFISTTCGDKSPPPRLCHL